MSKNLHLVPKLTKDQKFDKAMGCLTLSKAEIFTVEIVPTAALHNGAPKKLPPFKKLTQEEVWKMPDIGDRHMYVADHKRREKQEEEYEKDKDAFNKKISEELSTLSWCWEVIGNTMDGRVLEHNSDFTIGMPKEHEKRISFPEILVGGGFAWLEVFTKNDPALGDTPNGLFVTAKGTPQIVRIAWTDLDCKPITGKVSFGSTVLLNIYTTHMYGNNLEVELWDRDVVDRDDLLSISNMANFTCEVLIYKLLANEINKTGISGGIKINGKSETHVQKVRIPVLIDHKWMFSAGKNLKIYPTVKSLETRKSLKVPKDCFLEVSVDGEKHQTVIEQTNNPVVVGKVKTNIASFTPCQYTGIEMVNAKGEITDLYKEDNEKIGLSTIEVGLMSGIDKKKTIIQVDQNSNIDECILSGKSKHVNQLTAVVDNLPKNITILSQKPSRIDFESFFNYDEINLFEYFFLTESKLKELPVLSIKSNTCRHNHNINIKIVPDIKWEAYILITSKTSESFAHTLMPSDKDSFGDPIVTDEKGKPTRKNIFQIHQKKARETGVSAKKMTRDFTGEVHIKASTNNGANTSDYGAFIEDKIKTVLSTLSSVKEVLDTISHRDEAAKGNAQGAMQMAKDKNIVGSKFPVFIEFSFPTVRLGGGWYWDVDKKDGKVKCIGNLQFGLEPLIQGKGGIDLVAAADYIPPVKPVLAALRYVKVGAKWLTDRSNIPVNIDSELYFNLYVKGKIDLRQTIDFMNASNDKTDAKISLLIGIELGFKIKATISKVIYTKSEKAGEEKISETSTGVDGQLSAEAECGFVGIATGGRDEKGMYLQLSADFTGITLKVVGKLTISRRDKTPDNFGVNGKFDLVDYHKDICKTEKYYVL
ncbi:hypothetical protein [Flavobacterium humidisoli]|uniref:Uncharacterized protein n=1 Tax=Flavobacterium humidisoli TaxID=2937442 RepID=A0ABY4LX47_9FLAO|nr:hypothetical protein [Flavobacterium humidisoli]UPZ16240.1 hypothetical protein M0M44_02565 [Flavobacterium humidisoli]